MEPKSDSLGDHDGSQLRGRGDRAAAAAAAGRTLPRSRAKELGLEVQIAAWPEVGGRKGKKRPLPGEEGRIELQSLPEKDLEEPERLESLQKMNLEEQEQQQKGTQMSEKDLEEQKQLESLQKKNLEQQERGTQMSVPSGVRRRIFGSSKISKRDGQLLAGAHWLVHVSSTALDGEEIFRCSGTVIHWDKEKAWILTSYHVVFSEHDDRLYNPMPKLAIHMEKAVHLPNKGKYEGKMLFFCEHYELALLEIEVESTIEVEPPRDGSRPSYNDKILTLARDREMSLRLHHGTIMWQEENFFLLVKSDLCPCGIGGPVINHAGEIVGMTCYYYEDLGIISISTIRTCIKMWTKFGCIARPMLGMSFRTVNLLDIVRQDRLSCNYKIDNGFIVDEVTYQSDADKRGIRRGNVIRFLNLCPCYLPEFEDYLLDIGFDSLNGRRMNDFKLEVHDLIGEAKRTIILPLQISYGCEY